MNRLLLVLALALAWNAWAEPDIASGFVDQARPVFPQSELRKAREGWVLVNFSLAEDGSVIDPKVADSSGSKAYDKAAIDAAREWRLANSTSSTDITVLVNFVFDRSLPYVNRHFVRDYDRFNDYVDDGDLERANKALEKLVAQDLYPAELAYTWIARARLAEVRGDKVDQLNCFRKAMISDGQWLAHTDYLDVLKATTVLGVQTRDFASAVRDYDLLAQSGAGGLKLAEDLEETVEAARALVTTEKPYVAASMQMDVEHETPRGGGIGVMPGPGTGDFDDPPPRDDTPAPADRGTGSGPR